MVRLQPKNNEVTVPAIHLVEAPAWHDIRIGQVQESRRFQLLRPHVAQFRNFSRQHQHPHMTALHQRIQLGRSRHIGRQIEHGRRTRYSIRRTRVHLYVGKRIAIGR